MEGKEYEVINPAFCDHLMIAEAIRQPVRDGRRILFVRWDERDSCEKFGYPTWDWPTIRQEDK